MLNLKPRRHSLVAVQPLYESTEILIAAAEISTFSGGKTCTICNKGKVCKVCEVRYVTQVGNFRMMCFIKVALHDQPIEPET